MARTGPPRYAAHPLPERPYRLGRGGRPEPLPADAPAPPAAHGRTLRHPAELGAQAQQAFRYGVALYNAGCWWEAHEVWEALWGAAVRGSPLAALLQGLILLAAARLQAEAGRPAGAQRLTARALARLRGAGDGSPAHPLGVALDALCADCAAWLADPARPPLLRLDADA